MFRIAAYILIVLAVGLFFYWRHFCKRACRYFGIEGKKRKLIVLLVPLIGALLLLSAFSAAGILYLYFVLLCMLTELIALFFKSDRRKALFYTGLPALVLTLLVGVYAYVNMCTVRETDYTVTAEKQLSRPYTVVLVADMHYGNSLNAARVEKMCERIIALEPDLLLLAGDIVDESTPKGGAEEVFSLLGGVKTTYGVYYVSGNHDSGSYRKGRGIDLETALAGTGVVYLRDEVVPLGDELLLVGRKDASSGGRLSAAALLSGTDTDRYCIMLDHQPREYAESAAAGTDLKLSGHTHAGQIFPAGFLTTLFGSELNYGITRSGAMTAVVTSGASGWGFPLRTSRHSEFVSITVLPVLN